MENSVEYIKAKVLKKEGKSVFLLQIKEQKMH